MNWPKRRRETSTAQSSDGTSVPELVSSPDTQAEADISTTDYARRRRELMDMMSDLRDMGADALIDLPAVVVIGGQSAGKSSLVEAVSGINVPRDSGTCTRCPMECTMSSNATSWSCTITLRIGVDIYGKEQKPIIAAILNPSMLPSNFHTKSTDELKSIKNAMKFSRNVVCVLIEDPDATDLSFYDLPGLIQNEEADMVELVKSLAEHYIKKANTIILTTIPMSDDMENQQSMTLARDADPSGKRTIGVLTKPDTLGEGAINQRCRWMEIIEGRSENHKLLHGFYCVRLPDDAERAQHITRNESRRRAAEYLDTTSPWKDVTDRRRFGIPGFVSDVSRLLIQMIEEVLPRLREDVDKLLTRCNKDVSALPPPLENDPKIEVLERVNAFCDVFKSFINGSHEDKSLAQRNRARYALFKRDIRGTAPDFRPFDRPEEYVPLDDIDEKMIITNRDPGVKTMGIYDVRQVINDAIGWELPNNVPYQAKANLIAEFTKLWNAPSERCFADINDILGEVIDELINIHFGRFRVLEDYVGTLIRAEVEICKAHTQKAVKTALALETTPYYTQNTHYFQTLRAKWLAHYKTVRTKPHKYKVPAVGLSAAESPQESPTDVIYASVEPTGPFSVHQPSGMRSSSQRSNGHSYVPSPVTMFINREYSPVETPEVKALRSLAEAGYPNLRVSDLARLLPPDSWEEELIVMADVRAYYQVGYKRIIDHIPLTIEHSLHHALAKQLSQSLITNLLTDVASEHDFSERMSELVSEDPSVSERRSSLSARKKRLSDIRQRLMTYSSAH